MAITNTEGMLPSEKAKLYKKMYGAMKTAGAIQLEEVTGKGRRKKSSKSAKADKPMRLDEEMALQVGESRNQLQEVLPELQELVDRKRIALATAVDISYIDIRYQQLIYQYVSETGTITSYQVAALRKYLDAEDSITKDAFQKLMKSQLTGRVREEKIVLRQQVLRKYFPAEYSTEDMEKKIMSLLEEWSKGGNA